MYLSDELILTVYWYLYNLQTCIVVILCGIATHILSFAPIFGCGDLSTGPNRDRLIARAPQVVHIGRLWVGNNLDQIRTGALLPNPLPSGCAVSHGAVW